MQSLAILALSGCVGFIVVTIPLLLCSKTKKRPNDDTTSVLPAKLSTKDPVPAAAPTIVTNTPKEDNMLDRTQKENGHIADIHKTMKLRRKGSKKTKEAGFNVEGQKKEFEQIFKAMDCKVNTSILDRLARHKASDTTQDHSHSTASKSEDIRFTFSARRKKGNDEDTVYPKKKSSQTTPGAKSDPKANAAEDACNTPNADEEFFEDDGDEEPNDQNYMYNYREIYYVGQTYS